MPSVYALAPWLLALVAAVEARGDEQPAPLPQPWKYEAAMRRVAGTFRGRPGVVLHVGDSITYANPYSQWARSGEGRTAADRDALGWMHAGADDPTDGWWLARDDHPDGGRSHTAAGGLRADELLAGGKSGLPSLRALLESYRPEMVVLMVGTNDATAGRALAPYKADVAAAVDLILGRGAVCILSTIPPHPGKPDLAKSYNQALRALAEARGLPLIDYEREILSRRPDDWDGTLLGKGDVHPTAAREGVTAASAPTAANLRACGYLLRGWLSVRKIAEVKHAVLDAPAAEPAAKPAPEAEAHGEAVRLPVTRDTWFSGVGAEADGSNGGASRLKLKSYQEMSLVDVDPKPLRGRVVLAATLHLRSAGDPPLRRVTVGSFGADWVEGTATSYEKQPGSSTFRSREHPGRPWTAGGGDLCSVVLGNGGTTWRMADASPPDDKRWQRIAVDPAILAARSAGISRGLFLFDDTGSEWTRQGEKYTPHPFPNRFVHSRESGAADAPYLTAILGPQDAAAPPAPGALQSGGEGLPAGEAWASWTTPRDEGPAGTIGFFAAVDGREVPRDLIPLAGKPGDRVRMHLGDLGLKPGAEVTLSVRAVDGAGNVGEAATARVRVSDAVPKPLPAKGPDPFKDADAPLPKLAKATVAVVDELDKARSDTGALIPPRPEGYLAANHLWDARTRRVRLHAARNEFVAFQVLLRGASGDVTPSLTFPGGIEVSFGRPRPVATKVGPIPDPITPWDDGPVDDSPNRAIHVEVYVPHDARPGVQKGSLTLKSGAQTLAIGVELEVWDFALPDYLSFLPEMNCYGLPDDERGYYRMAHRHRTLLNRVPYSQGGQVAEGFAPKWDGEALDWSAWDGRFGPYFDGSAFADMPRRGVPLEGFYLPLHENWPTPIEGNYDGSYWADRAFPDRYRRAFVAVSRQMAGHFAAKGWNDTLFQGFLNGKNDFKRGGWSRGSSPWLLDEPAAFQDFWALRYFADAFHEGVDGAAGGAKLLFRADISRPQWCRDALDGLLDDHVVGGAFREYRRLVLDRKRDFGELVFEYGSTNAVEDSNVQPAAWCLDSWSLGTDGVLPWQTVGNADSWAKADELSLFYPPRDGKAGGPVPSARLKSYRRGQQDVEYLTLWAQLRDEPRWAIGRTVRDALHLAPERSGTGFQGGEDAGRIEYGKLRPEDLWALRLRIGKALSDAHPAPKRRLVELRTPPRDPSKARPAADFYAGQAGHASPR